MSDHMSKITKQVGNLYLGDEDTKEGSEFGHKKEEMMEEKKLDFDEEEGCWQVTSIGRNGLTVYPRASNAEEAKKAMVSVKLDFDEEEGCWQVFNIGRNGLTFYPQASNAKEDKNAMVPTDGEEHQNVSDNEEKKVAAESGDDDPEGPFYVLDEVNGRLVKYIKSTRKMSYWDSKTKQFVEFFSQFIEDTVIMNKHHLENCDLSDDPDENDGDGDDFDDDGMGDDFEEDEIADDIEEEL